MHRPLYCSDLSKPRCTNESLVLREFFEETFIANKVDLVLAGHLHNYERMYPIYQGKVDTHSLTSDRSTYVNPKFPTYVICGAAGMKKGTDPLYDHNPQFSQIVSNTTGICELSIDDENLTLDFVDSVSRQLIDNFSVLKTTQSELEILEEMNAVSS